LDLIDSLSAGTFNRNVYHAGDVVPGLQTLNASQLRQIASLMLNGLSLGGADADAATQLAIWKIEYGGSLTFNSLPSALANAVNQEITNKHGGWKFRLPHLYPDRTDAGQRLEPDSRSCHIRSGTGSHRRSRYSRHRGGLLYVARLEPEAPPPQSVQPEAVMCATVIFWTTGGGGLAV
jgi:hypothetical protein